MNKNTEIKISHIYIIFLSSIIFSVLLIACDEFLPASPESDEILNEPIEGLSSSQLIAHLEGDEQFGKIFSTEAGLGPIFVNTSCENCHIADGKGHPFIQLTRFGKMKLDGTFDPMIEYGGPQLQQRSISGYPNEEIYSEATGISIFMPPAVTGLGLLEAVPDAAILALADPDDLNSDGISGIPNYIDPPDYFQSKPGFYIENNGKYIGRFGRKAGAITILQQVTQAYLQDIGITSDLLPEDLYNYMSGSGTGDKIPDPELSLSVLKSVEFYIRTLKPPPRRNINDPGVLDGELIFKQINCSGCHVPTFITGTSDIEALNQKEFYPYTDLLMHDMGFELDDYYTEGTAKTSEWRTTPLWGLGLGGNSQGRKSYFLHDGRAASIEQAISFHGGEAANSRNSFNNLSNSDKENLLKFLDSL
ncbi:MAG: di-heme oxidoredictase family protein [Ignavibacteria bacterium]